jgi:hypothetical protein
MHSYFFTVEYLFGRDAAAHPRPRSGSAQPWYHPKNLNVTGNARHLGRTVSQVGGEVSMMRGRTRLVVFILLLLLTAAAGSSVPACAEAGAAEPPMSDEEIERFLLKGKVVDSEEVGTGITKPRKVTLELDGRTMHALFKDFDVEKPGLTRFPGGKSEMNFSDKYIYEVAAYVLDRRLGMNMVPVAVKRQWGGKTGAMIAWVEDGIKENERLEQGIGPDDPVVADYQIAIMRLFDALIYNVDRNQTNMLYTGDDWRLHLIDHSRSFRRNKDLLTAFTASPASLPPALLEELESLEEKELKTLLKNLVSGPQVKALMQRRDLILEKIAEDRKLYGDNMVFQQ